MKEKIRAGRNRTVTLSDDDIAKLEQKLLFVDDLKKKNDSTCNFDFKSSVFCNKTINGDIIEALAVLPDNFADLIIIDPPYNLTKNFNGNVFSARSEKSYDDYLVSWFSLVCKKLKNSGSLYLCGDWKCTSALQRVMEKNLTVLNRIHYHVLIFVCKIQILHIQAVHLLSLLYLK